MPRPHGRTHAITIIRAYDADPARAITALVKVLEKCQTAGDKPAAAREEDRDAARPST